MARERGCTGIAPHPKIQPGEPFLSFYVVMTAYHPCIFVIRVLNTIIIQGRQGTRERETSDETMNGPTVCTTSVGGSIDLHWGNPNRDGQILKKQQNITSTSFANCFGFRHNFKVELNELKHQTNQKLDIVVVPWYHQYSITK